MGRNRKGRQCGGYASKMERFVLHKRWQQEAAKCAARNNMARQAQSRLAQKERERKRLEANRALGRVRPRLDVLTAWTNARLKDDQMERLRQRGATAIASELEKTTATTIQSFSSLQERCIYELARTFDLFSATCPFTREFFSMFEPWMISRLSELTTAFKTMNDANVSLLLQQKTDQLTLGFVRHEKSLVDLFDQGEADRQRMTWQLNGPLPQYEAESWEELDVDEVELVESHEEARLESLCLISCTGLSLQFVTRLGSEHPFIKSLKVVDCFDVASGDNGAQLLLQLSRWRSLKRLHFSWCCWLTTELLVTFAYQLLEPPRSPLQELHVSDCFDVLDDYVRSVFLELHPQLHLSL